MFYCLQNTRKEKIGTICEDYFNLKERFRQLGKGGFGKVYKYIQSDTGERLAVKIEEKVYIYSTKICMHLAVNLSL